MDKLNEIIKYNNWEIHQILTGEITHTKYQLKLKKKNTLAQQQRTSVC